MPDTPPRMDREKLAMVLINRFGRKCLDIWGWKMVCGYSLAEFNDDEMAMLVSGINTAASAWLDSVMKKAMDAERERCAKIADKFAGKYPESWDTEEWAFENGARCVAEAIRSTINTARQQSEDK